jgi:hypothetical protein
MLTPVVLADFADTIQLTDRTDVRARATLNVPGQTTIAGTSPVAVPACGGTTGISCVTPALDVANTASAIFAATDRRWLFSAVYSPSITFSDLEHGVGPSNPPLVFQTLSGVAAWHAQFTRLSLAESVSFGHFNSSYLFQPGTPSGTSSPGLVPPLTTTTPGGATSATTTQLVPRPIDVYYGSSTTTLTLGQAIGRRSALSLGGGFFVAGGLDEQSRLVTPVAYGPRADASYSYAITRELRTITIGHAELSNLSATQCYTQNGDIVPGFTFCRPQNEYASVSEGLRDQLSRTTAVSVDAGIALTRYRTDVPKPYKENLYPEGGASLTHRLGPRGLETLILSATVSPIPNLLTGQILYGTQGSVTLIDALNPVVTMSVDAVGAKTFPTDNPLASSLVRGDVEARFRTDRNGRVVLVLGTSGLWQDQNALGGFFSVFGYFAVTISTPALRF